MGAGPDDQYLENSDELTPPPASASLTLPGALQIASRLVPPLAIGLLLLLTIGMVVFVNHARQADDAHSIVHRNVLRGAVEQLRISSETGVDAAAIQHLQEVAGVRQLRWESEPDTNGREVQSVQNASGRILGWLSWQPHRPVTAAAMRFMPLWGAIAGGLLLLAGVSMWYVRTLARELEAANERTRQASRYDPITGLPAASATLETLEKMLAQREADEFVTLCYIDLTGFRELADAFGRSWSNELVRAVADRLRKLEWPHYVLGRLGRQRFILVLRSRDADAGRALADDASELIARPMDVHGQVVYLRANIGLAYAPRDGLTSAELYRHATLAMRDAKQTGHGGIVQYVPVMEADLHERRFLERELKRAVEEEALQVHYQPIVAAEDSRIIGVEALLRWSHPTRGNIPPKVFVPIAEQTGMMIKLGEYVLYRAFNDAKRWPDLFLSVNLSPIQVKDRALFTLVSSMLEETGLDPKRLVLEITEGVLIDDPEKTRERLQEIRDLGLRIALDDFGSGYSSLSYLQRFPFDKLKIDAGFVSLLGKAENSAFIIQAIVALGRALNLNVLVEGVETEDQRTLLRLAGCDEMQGYLFAKAAPRQTIDALMLERRLQAAKAQQAPAQAS